MARNRGFKNPRGAGALVPRVRKVEGTRGRPIDPATQAPAQDATGLLRQQVYPPMPPTWAKSEGEWIVYWYLSEYKHWREGTDFFFDTRIFVQALLRGLPLTQVDFLIDLGPGSPAGQLGWYTALVLDPFTEFTHDYQYDKDRRAELERRGYLLIFLDEDALRQQTLFVLGEALKGRDHSNRGTGR